MTPHFTELDREDSRERFDRSLASPMVPEPFAPKCGDWEAGDFFLGLSREDVALDDAELEKHREFFWIDLCAEYDALHLHRHLRDRGDDYSPEFLAFEEAWYRDEMNHYRGFRALYALLYGEDEASLEARVARREPDFGPLQSFFGDEFRLAALFAYDELATTRAYHVDYALYRRLGHPRFMTFIRRLVRDESFHYQNAVAVMRRLHRDRLGELPEHIDDFVAFDLGGHAYRATFLFDHEWEGIGDDFFAENGEILKRRLAPRA
jgi:hypothetical protein